MYKDFLKDKLGAFYKGKNTSFFSGGEILWKGFIECESCSENFAQHFGFIFSYAKNLFRQY